MDLPIEMVLHVLGNVQDIKDIVSFAMSCKGHRELTKRYSCLLTRKVFGIPPDMRCNKYLKTSYYFVDTYGRVQGEAKLFRQNSVFAVSFLDNKKHGSYKQVSNDASVITKGNYEMGKKHGIWETVELGGISRTLWVHDNEMSLHHVGKSEYILLFAMYQGKSRCYERFTRVKDGRLGICPKSAIYSSNRGDKAIKYAHCCKKHQNNLPERLFC
ncbi:F-box containing protein [Insectomime virus]|uniref:F-box containing protein n=1 Tax=Tunisvirus fontaine2 TaxID=1421067 RepID=V9SH79_9VIRU|nr:F-box containing protein [Tunisvirus fontaine2]AHA46310.1 F-box containing protein [Insectomime virus]AHC55107.1 F-box containing protein [Tunisvirus fontaine2]